MRITTIKEIFYGVERSKVCTKANGISSNCIYLFTHAWLTNLVFWVTPIGLVLSLIPQGGLRIQCKQWLMM